MRLTLPDESLTAGSLLALASGPARPAAYPGPLARCETLPPLAAGLFLDDAQGPALQVLGAARWPTEAAGSGVLWLLAPLRDLPAGGELDLTSRRAGLSLAWVTLSDKGSRGERTDASGPAIETTVRAATAVSLARGFLLPDEAQPLRALLADLALLQGFDLILTTGGTGLTPRDITPEATLAVIERRLPGFEQAMVAASLLKTPNAVISRAVAGTVGQSLVVNLPGSPKAVVENLAAVLPAIPHALDKLRGDPADCGR